MANEILQPDLISSTDQGGPIDLGITPTEETPVLKQREVQSNAIINTGAGLQPSNNDEIDRLSNDMKLPKSFVERNYDYLVKQQKEAKLKVLRDTDKGLAKWMDSPDKASLAGGDIESIGEISRLMQAQKLKREGKSRLSKVHDAAVSGTARALSGLAKLPLAAHQIVAFPYNVAAEQLDMEQIKAPDFLINNPIIDYYDEVAKSYGPQEGDKGIVGNIKEGNLGEASFNTFLGVVENIPQLAMLAMTASAGLGRLGLAGMGAVTAGEKLSEKLPEGVSPVKATTEAILHGGAEIGGEYVTLGLLNKNFRGVGAELVKTMGKDGARKTITRSIGNVLKDSTSEGLSELATTAMQDVSSYLMGDVDALDGTAERMLESFLVGAALGGGMATYGSIRQEMQQSGEYRTERENLIKLEEIVDSTGMKKASPEAAEGMIDNMINGEKVYVSHEAVANFFQSDKKEGIEGDKAAKEETNEFLKELDVQDQTTSVLTTGGEYEISKAKWLVKYGKSDIANALREDLRFAADGLNGNDIETIKLGVSDKVKAMQEEIKNLENLDDVKPEQLTTMREQLMRPKNQGGMGIKADKVDAQLQLMVAAGEFTTRYTGESMEQWWNRRNPQLEIGGEFEGAVRQTVPLRKYEDLQENDKVEADNIIDNFMASLSSEIGESTAGHRKVGFDAKAAKRPGETGAVVAAEKSTFPDWFKELNTNKKSFIKAIESKKGVVYERIKVKARELLESGYVSKTFGEIAPDNKYRKMLGMPEIDAQGNEITEDEYYQMDKPTGVLLGKDEKIADSFKKLKTVKKPMLKLASKAENLWIPTSGIGLFKGAATTKVNKVLANKRLKNAETGKVFKITNGAINDVTEQIFEDRAGAEKGKLQKKTRAIFRGEITALQNIGRLINSAVKVVDNADGSSTYFAMGATKDNDIGLKIIEKDGKIIKLVPVVMKSKAPPASIIPEESGTQSGTVDNISVADFTQLVNKGRDIRRTGKDEFLFQQDTLGFFSKVKQEIDKMDFKSMPAKNLANRIAKIEGIKKEELEYTGIIDLLNATEGKVSKEDVQNLLDQGGLQLEEVTKGVNSADFHYEMTSNGEYELYRGEGLLAVYKSEAEVVAQMEVEKDEDVSGDTKYESYTIPGGENYREVLLTMPEKEVAPSKESLPEGYDVQENPESRVSPFTVVGPSIIEGETKVFSEGLTPSAAIRNFHKLPGGKTKEKYRSAHWDESNVLAHFRLNDRIDSEGRKTLFIEEIQSDWHQEGRRKGYDTPSGVPGAPFKTTEAWSMLAFKRILRQAAEQGYEAVSWTPGEVQNERYDLSKQIDEIKYSKNDNGYVLDAYKGGRNVMAKDGLTISEVEANVGKDIADKIEKGEGEGDHYKSLSGVDLQVGGEGMKGFYDKMLPKAVGKYVKKLDKKAKVGVDKIATEELQEPELSFKEDDQKRMEEIAIERKQIKEQISDLRLHIQAQRSDFNGKERSKIVLEINELMDKRNNEDDDSKEERRLQGEIDKKYAERDKLLEDAPSMTTDPRAKKLQDKAQKLIKEQESIEPISEETHKKEEVWHLPITDKLKAKVLEGQTLFQGDKTKGPRAAIRFEQNKTIINLFNGANMSSLLHETGHIFIQEMQEIVDSGKGDAQLTKDLQTLKNFADGEFNVEGIEKVVRGFETYLMEGKAPSIELQSAFGKFAEWLMTIYSNIKGQLPKIDNNVRAVFDRMLASNEQINEIEELNKQKETIAELIDAPKKVKLDAKEKQETASLTAKQRLLAKRLAIYIKANGGKKGIIKEKTAIVEDEPFYKSMEYVAESGGINKDEALEHYGKDKIKEINNKFKGAITDNGSMTIGEVSLKFEFESDNAFIDDMAEQKSKQDKIDEMVDQDIAQAELDLTMEMSDNEGFKGEEEYHSEERLTSLISDYEALRLALDKKKKAKSRAFDRKVYRDVAREELLKTKTSRATRYDLYGKTEQRYANSSYKFAQNGNLEKALEHKNKQILNHIMVQESVKLRDQKVKIEKSYQTKKVKAKFGTKESRMENDYVQLSSALINRFQLNKAIQATEEIKDLADFDENLSEQLPQWVLQGETPTGEQNYKEMAFKDFLTLDESIKSIMHSGKDTLLSMINSEYKTVAALVEKSVESMKDLRPKKIPSEKQMIAHWAVGMKDSFISKVKMMEYLMEELDNYEMHRNGDFGVMRQLWNRGRAAEGEFKDLQRETLEIINPHMDILLKAKDRIEAERGTGLFEIEGAEIPEIMKAVGRDNWTAERAVSFLLNVGNEHNLQVIQNAYGYNKENIDAVSSLFEESELKAIQGIWDGINTLYQPLTDTNFRMHNRNLEKVEANEITLISKDGTEVVLEGGYYPLQFDRSISDVAQTQQDIEVNKDASSGVLRSSKPKDGMTKIRGQQHSLPPLLSLSVLTRHIIETSRFITHSEYLRDIDRVTKNKEWVESMKSKVGGKMYKELRDNLKFQASPKRKPTYSFDKWMDKQRAMSTSLILGLNMSVALKQRLSGFSAQVDLGGTWIAQSLADADLSGSILGKSSSKMWTEIREKSKYIRAREGSIDREINDMVTNMNPFMKKFNMKAFGKEVTLKDARDAMFFLIQANDRAMTGIVWKAAYNKTMAKYVDSLTAEEAEMKAIEFADATVAQTQPSALPLDVNAFQRSEGYTRLFTSFMTWTFKQGNRFVHKRNAYKAGAISRRDYIAHIVQEGVAAPVLAAMIGSMMLTGELPDWWELGVAPIDYGLSWIPFVRDISGAIRYRRKIGESPAFEGANRLLHTGKTGFDWLSGDKEFNDFIWSVGRSGEALTGIPALKAAKNMKNAYLIATGQKKN